MQNIYRKSTRNIRKFAVLAAGVIMLTFGAQAGTLAVMCAENGDLTCGGSVAALLATGKFSAVTGIDSTFAIPTLSQLSAYDAVLAVTDYIPVDPTGLGSLLASYYGLGNRDLTIATYAFSDPWAIGGDVMTGADAALTNSGMRGDVSGNIVATVPGNPIFNGIDLSMVTYFHNLNYAHPGLAPGATLLATDGSGVDLIARSSGGVVDFNLFPDNPMVDNAIFYDLLGNALTLAPVTSSLAPEPGSIGLFVVGLTGLALRLRRRR